MKPIKIRIDVSKIDKSALYRSEKSGAVYLDLVAWPIKGESRYGETHSVKQQFAKDDPRGNDSPFLGNLTMPEAERRQEPPRQERPPQDPHGRDRSNYQSPRQAATPAHRQQDDDYGHW